LVQDLEYIPKIKMMVVIANSNSLSILAAFTIASTTILIIYPEPPTALDDPQSVTQYEDRYRLDGYGRIATILIILLAWW
jgi:hypothetical protein